MAPGRLGRIIYVALLGGVSLSPLLVAGAIIAGFDLFGNLVAVVPLLLGCVLIASSGRSAWQAQACSTDETDQPGKAVPAFREATFIFAASVIFVDLSMLLLRVGPRTQTVNAFGMMALIAGSVGLLWSAVLLCRAVSKSRPASDRLLLAAVFICFYSPCVIGAGVYVSVFARTFNERRLELEEQHQRNRNAIKSLPK